MESGGSSVRTRILRAATDVFADKGYAGASIADISSAAGITKPMLYYYFGDKAGLFEAVIQQVHARLEQGLGARVRDGKSALEQLGDIAELVFEAARSEPTESRLRFAALFGTSTDAAREALTRCATLVQQSILQVAELGVMREELGGVPEDITSLIQGALNMRVMAFLSSAGAGALPAGEGRRMISLLVQGIGRGAPSA